MGPNNNNQNNVYAAVVMTSHCKSSMGSFDKCRPAQETVNPKIK